MQIRDATISDLPRLTDIWLTGIHDDRDYDTVYPWRHEAPADFRRLMTAEIEDAFLKGEERYLVVETETETAQRQVVAWVSWTRNGSSDAAAKIRAQNDSLLKRLERTFRDLQKAILCPLARLLPLGPAQRESHLVERYYEKYNRYRKQFWTGDIEEHWFVKRLSVDPEWRRQGIARMLMQWGQDRAQEENVVVALHSSELGMSLYKKLGFVQVMLFELDQTDLRVPVLVWRPKMA